MLVLARKKGEAIVIDVNIKVTVLEIRDNQVRLGIEAPPQIVVDREEVHQAKLLQAAESASSHAAE